MGDIKIRIKQIRKDNKLSQSALGKLIGISRSQISCYEKGLRDITERSLNDICREFNVNKEWLLTGKGEMYIISEKDKKIADTLAKKIVKLDKKSIDRINDLIDLLLEKENKI